MSQKNSSTEDILTAIRDMMSEKTTSLDETLPKDVIELTDPIKSQDIDKLKNEEVLELINPINENSDKKKKEIKLSISQESANFINEENIRSVIRKEIESIPKTKIYEIINEELTDLIKRKINLSKFVISTEDN